MLLISSWKIESVEWLLSLRCSIMMKPLTRFQYHRYNYRTQTRSKIVRSMLNVTESGQHLVYSILLSLTFPSNHYFWNKDKNYFLTSLLNCNNDRCTICLDEFLSLLNKISPLNSNRSSCYSALSLRRAIIFVGGVRRKEAG